MEKQDIIKEFTESVNEASTPRVGEVSPENLETKNESAPQEINAESTRRPVLPSIRFYPDPLLREVSKPVEEVNDEVLLKVNILFECLKEYGGIGLSAPQVGWLDRIFVMNLTGDPEDNLALINPVVVNQGGKKIAEVEGCLSFPGVYAKVKRKTHIKVKALSLKVEPIEFDQSGLMARCILHELDHLDGMLFIDKVSPIHKTKLKKPLKALREYRKAVLNIKGYAEEKQEKESPENVTEAAA